MNITVFCGSASGINPIYTQKAAELGALMAQQGHHLVYGGGHVGMMGTIADAVLKNGGYVTGVIPMALEEKELSHKGVQELHVVADMHERKAMMANRGDAFVALPGGIGTLEEIFEAWTWAQLGYHQKPVAFLDINGYYSHLFKFLNHVEEEGFILPYLWEMIIIEEDMAILLEKLQQYKAPKPKWA